MEAYCSVFINHTKMAIKLNNLITYMPVPYEIYRLRLLQLSLQVNIKLKNHSTLSINT
jgi:hypothetical protein